jgi:hypothetical protein
MAVYVEDQTQFVGFVHLFHFRGRIQDAGLAEDVGQPGEDREEVRHVLVLPVQVPKATLAANARRAAT